jgi:phosphoribosylformimino-5-aminoimidazole carboxamide ribotide isomerase
MQIIPAIDIIAGNCVRLSQGDYQRQTTYSTDPLTVARRFEDAGMQRLHLVDLEGAKAGEVVNLAVLEKIAAHTALQIDFGGGIHTYEAVEAVISAGATWVTVGSVAVKAKEKFSQWITRFGAERFMLGADVKGIHLAVSGWTETTDQEIVPFLEHWTSAGIQQVFCTDISKDGLLSGPSLALYQEIIERHPGLFFIASGGVSSIEDLSALQELRCSGAIVGKAIYENKITLEQLANWNK